MTGSNYVCIGCRTTARVQENRSAGICPKCHKPLQSVGRSQEIPKKNDDKGWANLIIRSNPRH